MWRRVACGLTLALVAGCGGGGPYADTEPGVVRAFWTDPPKPIEPANTNEVQGGKVLDMTFRGLKRYDPVTGKAVNAVAKSIETEDQRTFRITLKKGWRFSDGSPVTAHSFVNAWNYGAYVANAQVNSYFFEYIEGYEDVHPESGKPKARRMSGLKVTSPHSFTVTLNQKFSLWPRTLGYSAYAPLPEKFFTDHDAWMKKPVGNGPYRVDRYDKGQAMKLSRNPYYAGEDKPRNKGVELRVYTDQNTAYTDLQANNLDVIDELPAAQLKNAPKDLEGRYINQPAGIFQTLSFPMYRKEWKQAVLVRRGLSMAVNRDEVAQQIYSGTRKPATDLTSPVLHESGGYSTDMCGEVCEYHPEKARRLIERGGGLPGGKVTISSNVDTGSHQQWMEAVCNSINATLRRSDACSVNPVPTFGEFRGDVQGQKMTSLFRAGWQMDYPLIQNFLQPLYTTDGSSNDSGYSDKTVDALMHKANSASQKDAVGLFQKAERKVLRDFPAIPLWYQNGNAGYSERVSGVRLNPFSVPVFTDIRVR